MLDQELQKIGLSEKEAKVYIATMELGQAPVQKIAQKAKVNRATTYVILEALQQKGVISTVDQGKKRFFVAESPSSLHHIIEEQQEALKGRAARLKEMMPELETLHNLHPNKPTVRFYEGKEGLKTILEERLADKPKEVNLFYSTEDVQTTFSEEEILNYRAKRVKQGTKYHSIRSTENVDERVEIELTDSDKVSYKKYPFHSDIAVYNDKVSISILKGHVSGIVIESKAVADTFRSIFQLVKDLKKDDN